MQKERSVFESRFRPDRLGDLSEVEEDLLLASLMMILLLERDRGLVTFYPVARLLVRGVEGLSVSGPMHSVWLRTKLLP
jgi:hypothetical protein